MRPSELVTIAISIKQYEAILLCNLCNQQLLTWGHLNWSNLLSVLIDTRPSELVTDVISIYLYEAIKAGQIYHQYLLT